MNSRTELAYSGEWESRKVESVEVLFWEPPLVLFLGCAVMFHFANAAMLPLLMCIRDRSFHSARKS